MSKSWWFLIEVREGAPGYADDDTYMSEKYESFEKCYRKYVEFKPYAYWRNLRSVQHEYIMYRNGDIVKKNIAHSGGIQIKEETILDDLGTTEAYFDDIIEQIENSLKD